VSDVDDPEAYRRAIESAANWRADAIEQEINLEPAPAWPAGYALQRQMGKPVRPVGTTQSEFDGLGPVSPPNERDAAALRARARATGDSEPPWGGAYTGSETSKARRRR